MVCLAGILQAFLLFPLFQDLLILLRNNCSCSCMNKAQTWYPCAHNKAPIEAQDLQHCTETPPKPRNSRKETISHLYSAVSGFFNHSNPLAPVIQIYWYFSAVPRLAALVFPALEVQSPGVMQVMPHRCRAQGLQGQSCLGRAGRALPLPSDTSQTCLLHINIRTTTPLQSLLKALIKTLTFLIPSIFCSLLIK